MEQGWEPFPPSVKAVFLSFPSGSAAQRGRGMDTPRECRGWPGSIILARWEHSRSSAWLPHIPQQQLLLSLGCRAGGVGGSANVTCRRRATVVTQKSCRDQVWHLIVCRGKRCPRTYVERLDSSPWVYWRRL